MAREGIYFVSPDSLGDSVAMGCLTMDTRPSDYYGLTARVSMFPHAGFSDYSGTAVERSNHAVIIDQLGDSPGIVRFYGSHGSEDIAYQCNEHGEPATGCEETDTAIREIVAALSDYPLLDEDHHSQLECEIRDSAWESYGRSDFRRALIDECAGDDDDNRRNTLEDMADERIDHYYFEACNHVGWEFEIETGGSVHFNFRDAAPLALAGIFADGSE